MNLSQMRYYKQQKGYSLNKISELSGVPRGTLQKIFSGETGSPRYSTLQAIEKVLRPGGESRSGQENGYSGIDDEKTVVVKENAAVYGEKGWGTRTLEDYYALPEEHRVELIDGIFYDMSSPAVSHQLVSVKLIQLLGNFIDREGGDCIPLVAPTDVQLDRDESTMVIPDVMVLCDRRKLGKRCVLGAPDFIVEILSPATRRKDALIKLTKYRNSGVREYWMVDLEKERVITYYFEEDELPVIYEVSDEVPVGIFGGRLRISMKEIFESVREIR